MPTPNFASSSFAWYSWMFMEVSLSPERECGAHRGLPRPLQCVPLASTCRACMIDRERLEAICREAGAMALRQWPGHGHALESWDKTPGSPVCTADLEVDAFLKRELQALLPAAGW